MATEPINNDDLSNFPVYLAVKESLEEVLIPEEADDKVALRFASQDVFGQIASSVSGFGA